MVPHGKIITARSGVLKADKHEFERSVKKARHLRNLEDLEAELCEDDQLCPIEAEHPVQQTRSAANYERDDLGISMVTKHGNTHRPREPEAPLACNGHVDHTDQ